MDPAILSPVSASNMIAKPAGVRRRSSRGSPTKARAAKPVAAVKRAPQAPTWKITGAKGRLKSKGALKPADFQAIAATLGIAPVQARKSGLVAARRAKRARTVETHWNGKETTNRAGAGDWIVTSLSAGRKVLRDSSGRRNTYVIAGNRFGELYEAVPAKSAGKLGAVYRAKGVVSALRLGGGFDILAPWGERQTGRAGYLILNGEEVYGNNADTFAATYEPLDQPNLGSSGGRA
jgi:hypothetical protein